MFDTLVSISKEQPKKDKYLEIALKSTSDFFLDNQKLLVSVSKKEEGIVIKIKKNKNLD